jgi:hypothetical protein
MRAPIRLQLGTDGISSLQVHDRSPLNLAVSAVLLKSTRHTGERRYPGRFSRFRRLPPTRSGVRQNDKEGFILRCDLLGMIALQKVLPRSERPVTEQASRFESMVPATP